MCILASPFTKAPLRLSWRLTWACWVESSRMILSAILRGRERFCCGALSLRSGLASFPKLTSSTSSTQLRRFSMPQCARTASARAPVLSVPGSYVVALAQAQALCCRYGAESRYPRSSCTWASSQDPLRGVETKYMGALGQTDPDRGSGVIQGRQSPSITGDSRRNLKVLPGTLS